MGYQISWLIDKRIIYIYQYGITTLEELKEIIETQLTMQSEGVAPVHIINEATDIEKLTFGLMDIKKVLELPRPNTESNGWYILVSPDRFKRFIANISAEISGGRHREFTTIEEAIAFLQGVDDSLGKIPLPETSSIP